MEREFICVRSDGGACILLANVGHASCLPMILFRPQSGIFFFTHTFVAYSASPMAQYSGVMDRKLEAYATGSSNWTASWKLTPLNGTQASQFADTLNFVPEF